MTRTLTLVPILDDAGKVNKTTIETYHCSLCGSFAGSEEKCNKRYLTLRGPYQRISNCNQRLLYRYVHFYRTYPEIWGTLSPQMKKLLPVHKTRRGKPPRNGRNYVPLAARPPWRSLYQLSEEEFVSLKSHFATSSSWGGRRTLPYVFTEQGIAMLSSVLNSDRAIEVNIQIMRTFVKLREIDSMTLTSLRRNFKRNREGASRINFPKVLFGAQETTRSAKEDRKRNEILSEKNRLSVEDPEERQRLM